jgi:PTS system galactitol-specific IIC component
MGAVMELIPRITSLFIEGLKPIADATRELIAKKYKHNAGLSIGMTPALVIGHPATLVVSLLLIPVTIFLAVVLPGNRFLPLASLAGMFYLFPMILPITKGNVLKSFIIGLVALIVGLYFVTNLSGYFTMAAKDVFAATGDKAVDIPDGFDGGALDFASSLFCWVIFHLTHSLKIVGPALLVLLALGMAVYNRIRMTRQDKMN